MNWNLLNSFQCVDNYETTHLELHLDQFPVLQFPSANDDTNWRRNWQTLMRQTKGKITRAVGVFVLLVDSEAATKEKGRLQ